MIAVTLLMLVSLAVILAASELFTNALEHFGERARLSEGATGSVFASVGTALPETMVPLLAILAGSQDPELGAEIGVGSILGSPLMLSTLSVFLMGLSVLRRRGLQGVLTPEPRGIKRDLNFYLIAFSLSTLALFIPPALYVLRLAICLALMALYGLYVARTLHVSGARVEAGELTSADAPLHLTLLRLPNHLVTIVLQLLVGLGLLIAGARWFIDGVSAASDLLGVSPLLIALLVIPLATELPEKVNSILWVRRGRDTLAFGNISGAMVFQGTLLPAIGILLTPWTPRPEIMQGLVVTLLAAVVLRVAIRRGRIPLWLLGVNGLLYVAYIAISVAH
ncbi:sodium:calcium antiporter [Kushneria aurantia]|uniref:Sodium:calcium antiporter n=1 Tax=Kushneria aurantia TaxID=504092 RepID=A0ABV6G1H6_9GAMM|nr:sodium:calcium antiporter [Kushneria aurantia]